MGFAAVNTANNLIYVITSTLLGFMLISGIAGKTNLASVEVKISLPEEIYAETPAPVVVQVRNQRRFLPVFLVSVSVELEQVLFPYLDGLGQASRTISLRFDRRGMTPSIRLWVSSPFPFGFFVRSRPLKPIPPIVVFPKLLPCGVPSKPSPRTMLGDDKAFEDRTGEEHDLRSIREYQPGDPLKKIHWKSSARTGRWLTKEFSIAAEDSLMVDPALLPFKNLEARLSCAAFIINWALRRGKAVGLVLGSQRYEPKASLPYKRELLKILALYGED